MIGDQAIRRRHPAEFALAGCESILRETAAQRDELRAVLAPLLGDPIRYPDAEQYDAECVFCDDYRSLPEHHAPDCPVLRRDALLGR